jgi:hypothetical protein
MRAFALAIVVALSLCAAASGAHEIGAATAAYADPTGDAGTAADIGAVSASVDAAQQLTFHVGLKGRRGITSLFIDSDANPDTGAPKTDGADFVLDVDDLAHAWYLSRWTGSAWTTDTPDSTVEITSTAGELILSVNRSDLAGAADRFNFWVGTFESWDVAGEGHSDGAPDKGTFTYTFGPLKLSLAAFHAVSAAGALLVTAVVERSDTGAMLGAEGAVSCSATVAGHALPVVSSGFLVTGANKTPVATCAYVVTKKLRGKLAQGQLSVALEGTTVGKSFRLKLK